MAGLKIHQHKILTKEGWKGYEDYLLGSLRTGEDIWVFNPNTELYEWTPLLGIDFNPLDRRVILSILNKEIEFGLSQYWLVDVQYPPDLQINNKYGLISSKTLSNIDSNRDSFGLTWNKHVFYIQAGLINLDVFINMDSLTPYKESKFTINTLDDYIPTWSPLTVYHNALVLTEELVLLTGCSPSKSDITSNTPKPYALSKTLITSSPINLSEFEGLPNNNIEDLVSIELMNINASDCNLYNKNTNTQLPIPHSIPYYERDSYEIRNINGVPNALVCTFRVKDISGNLSSNEGHVRAFRHRDSNEPPPTPTPFPIDPYDIVTKGMGNVSKGYLQLDEMSYVPPSIKIRWESLIDIPKLKVDWEDIENKPVFRISWDEIERVPSLFPTSWEMIANKPLSFGASWDEITNKPDAFPPTSHSHTEYALKIHTHSIEDFNGVETLVRHGDSLTLLENNAGYITLNDITPLFIRDSLLSVDGLNSGIDADKLQGYSPSYFTNASNISSGILGPQRLPMFEGDVYSFMSPTNLLLTPSGVTPDTYSKVTVDEKGRVIEGGELTLEDIPDIDGSKITTGIIHPSVLPLATTTEPGVITLSDSPLDNTPNTVPTSQVINQIYERLDTFIPLDDKGIPGGVPTLDLSGLIPLDQLPPDVDEVTYVDTLLDLPPDGHTGFIYVVISERSLYIWDGGAYQRLGGSNEDTPKLTTPRNISIEGDGTWSVEFDGSQDVSNDLVLAPTGVISGTYTKVTVDEKGRVVQGTTLITPDLPLIDGGSF